MKTKDMKKVVLDTPIEMYEIQGRDVFVKREDLCIQEAKFSKMRGVYAHLSKVKENFIGVLDSYHSKAGWGVSYICSLLGKQAILFYPDYKAELGQIRESQINGKRLGAELIPLKAGMQAVLYNIAKKELKAIFEEDGYMMPNALKLFETVEETALQVDLTDKELFYDTTWIISVSSGTIAAGVIKGLINNDAKVNVKLHLGYSRKSGAVLSYLKKYIPTLDVHNILISTIDEGYNYKDGVEYAAPFPCNKYYDLKAWKWLNENIEEIKTSKIMFWNIGE